MFEKLMSFVGVATSHIISETYNWFASSASSSLRQPQYRDLYEAIDDGHNPLKIVLAYQTRWLSIESTVKRMLEQWLGPEINFRI